MEQMRLADRQNEYEATIELLERIIEARGGAEEDLRAKYPLPEVGPTDPPPFMVSLGGLVTGESQTRSRL